MAFFSFLSKSHHEVAVIYDIGSASIGAALVRYQAGTVPTILYAARAPIQFQREVNAKRFLAFAVTALDEVTTRILKEGLLAASAAGESPRIRSVSCILSSPWLISKTHIIHYEKPEPFNADKKLIHSLVEEEREKFSTELSASPRKSGAITIIEDRVISLRANGYDIPDGNIGMCQKLSIAAHLSAAPTEAIEAFKKVIHHAFNFRKIAFDSFPLVYFSTVRDIRHDEPDFLCIDITGEVTDILVARDGILREVASFPLGKHHFARTISAATGAPEEAALGMIRAAAHADGTTAPDPQVAKALLGAESEWKAALKERLADMSERTFIPKCVFVTSDPDVGPYFTSIVGTMEFDALGVGQDMFEATFLGSEETEKYVTTANGIVTDAFLSIETAFYNKLFGR